jgi:hypothetical protein
MIMAYICTYLGAAAAAGAVLPPVIASPPMAPAGARAHTQLCNGWARLAMWLVGRRCARRQGQSRVAECAQGAGVGQNVVVPSGASWSELLVAGAAVAARAGGSVVSSSDGMGSAGASMLSHQLDALPGNRRAVSGAPISTVSCRCDALPPVVTVTTQAVGAVVDGGGDGSAAGAGAPKVAAAATCARCLL